MKRRAEGGFSMVEVLIGMLLTALLLQAMFSLLSTSFQAWRILTARTQTHQVARMAMGSMTRELRRASFVFSPTPGEAASSIRITAPDAVGKAQGLTFQLGTQTGGNMRTLYRIPASGQPSPLTENSVSQLQFEFVPPRQVIVSLTVTDPRTGVADSLQTAVNCLNVPD